MSLNIAAEIGKFTSGLTDQVAAKAKDSAITTLKDPEFKSTINQFTKDWYEENKIMINLIVGSFLVLSVLAFVNILTNLRVK